MNKNIIMKLLEMALESEDSSASICSKNMNTLNEQVGEKVIVRTYAAGVHFGTLAKKSGSEVILYDSRRLFKFKCPKSISLSDIALHGVVENESRITDVVPKLWLEAIEIISVTPMCIKSIENCPVTEQDL